MQKLTALAILVCLSLLAKSQADSTDYTLSNIKRYATQIEGAFAVINSNLEMNKLQAVVPLAEQIKIYIDSVEEEMQYLPDVYYYRLSPLVSWYHTDVDEFEKLILNKDFVGKDKFITKAFANLQQRQISLGRSLQTAYETAAGQSPLRVNNEISVVMEEDTASLNSNSVVLVTAVNASENTQAANALLLDTIHAAQAQMEQWLAGMQLALKKSNFTAIGASATAIANGALKIRDLSLLLATSQKESLYILATGLNNLADTLNTLSVKGAVARTAMKDYINRISIKFGTLSTGIRLVQ